MDGNPTAGSSTFGILSSALDTIANKIPKNASMKIPEIFFM